MMFKKYDQTGTGANIAPVHAKAEPSAASAAAFTAPPAADKPHTEAPAAVPAPAAAPQILSADSVIGRFLAGNNISVLEMHRPEDDPELHAILYLLDCIADRMEAAEELLHVLRRAIAENDGKFTYAPTGLSPEQYRAVKELLQQMKMCGIFSELRMLAAISGTVSSAVRVRSFLSGTWLELYGHLHGGEVISEKAKQLGVPFEVLSNVKVADQSGTEHEIDMMFSVGEHVFACEMKSGQNFIDYDKYRLVAEYLHLIPDRFLLVNSVLLDKKATGCVSYFYRYFICNCADYISTLAAMIDKAFR